jgi:hypothetical protein
MGFKAGVKNENTAVEIRHADHVAPSNPQKLALTSPTSSGRSVGIVRSRTQATVYSFFVVVIAWFITFKYSLHYFGMLTQSISQPSNIYTSVEEFTLEQISKDNKETLATGSLDHSYMKVVLCEPHRVVNNHTSQLTGFDVNSRPGGGLH